MNACPDGHSANRTCDTRRAWWTLLAHRPAVTAPAFAAAGVLLGLWASGGTRTGVQRSPGLALAAPAWVAWLLALAALALLAWLARAALSRARRRRPADDEPIEAQPRKLSPGALLVLVLLLLVPPAVVLVFLAEHPWLGLTTQQTPARTPTLVPGRQPAGAGARQPASVAAPRTPPPAAPAAVATMAVGLLLALALWAWLRHRRQLLRAEPVAAPPRRADEAGSALPDPHGIAEPRRAVVLCYRHLEELLAERDCPRRPWMTAAEFAHTVLARLPSVPPRAVHELTALFEEARFSEHVMSARARDSALDALAGIHAATQARAQRDGERA